MRNVTSLSLQKKLSATLLLVMVCFGLLSLLILQLVIKPAFDNLELEAAQEDLTRAERALQADLQKLISSTGDWAPWDDAHAYVQGLNPRFISSNADIPTLVNLDLNLMAFYNAAGELLYRQLVVDGRHAPFETLGLFAESDPRTTALISHSESPSVVAGLAHTNYGPMLISTMPIVPSAQVGPIAGTLVMARFLDAPRVEQLSQQSATEFQAMLLTDVAPLPFDPATTGSYFEQSTDIVAGYTVLPDIDGNPYLVLRSETPTEISSLGGRTVDATVLFLAVAGVLVAIVAWFSLQRMIVQPLARLARHITAIRRSGNLSQQLNSERRDEIGALSNEFDKLTGEVRKARQLLLEQSFKAGKADTAAEVLHNIRNAMTPLVNGLERLSQDYRAGERLRIKDATAALASPDCPAGKRDKFLEYIDASFEHLQSSSAEAEQELAVAIKQARQVEGILADQERHAQARPVYETLRLDDLAEEAVHVVPQRAGDAPVRINLGPDLGRHRVRAHRVGLQQILGNLVLNAYESIQRCQAGEGEIAVSAGDEVVGEQRMVRLTVADNGCGFDAQTGDLIFQRGFTSKQGPLTGLGLHWCANAVAGMGGRIRAESNGPGQGASFHLLLPEGG